MKWKKKKKILIGITLTLRQIASFKYAPKTSYYDVERSFSRYKSIFRSNRRSFVFHYLNISLQYVMFNVIITNYN